MRASAAAVLTASAAEAAAEDIVSVAVDSAEKVVCGRRELSLEEGVGSLFLYV